MPSLPFGIEFYGGLDVQNLNFFLQSNLQMIFCFRPKFGAMFRKSFNLRLFSFSTCMNSFLHLNLS